MNNWKKVKEKIKKKYKGRQEQNSMLQNVCNKKRKCHYFKIAS